jgi:hypothetical protein
MASGAIHGDPCISKSQAKTGLNSGVAATEFARRTGHSVAVLLKVYAHCIDGQDTTVNKRSAEARGAPDEPGT